MATGTLPNQHKMDLVGMANYTSWLTLASGITLTNTTSAATLRHVEKNIWYLYISVQGTFPANVMTTIGTINQNFFNAAGTAYIPALAFSGSNTYPATGRMTAAGVLDVAPGDVACTQVNIQGFFVTREV